MALSNVRHAVATLVVLGVLSCGPGTAAAPPEPNTIADGAWATQGAWDFEQWQALAERVAAKLADSVTDRYGKRETPLWVSGLDPDTGGLVTQKPPNWQTYWEAEDYVMTVQGCNMQRDMPMLSAFEQLSRVTGNPRYQEAVNGYLECWLRECPSPKTGLFPWGEHMSYNAVRDNLIAKRHELEQNLPDWDLLWRINPDAVRREIEAIHEIHIWDKDTFLYDRHGNYYTGEFDPAPVRGTYIKHSGLYVHAFMTLFAKTGEQRYLDWARKMSDLYWRHRAPETNLIYGYVSENGGSTDSTASLLLAYYLLEAVKVFPDRYVQDRALGIVDAFLKYGYNADEGTFAGTLDPATGAASQWNQGPWNHSTASGFYAVYALWDAYEITRDVRYLAVLQARLRVVALTPIPEAITPEVAGMWLQLYVKAFRALGDRECLGWARSLAAWSARHLVRDDYILEAANGYVYLNYGRPGNLLQGWLDLYEVERAQPLHWKTDLAVRPGREPLTIRVRCDATTPARLTWMLQDGSTGRAISRQDGSDTVYEIPIPAAAAQGPMSLIFTDADSGQRLDAGSVLVAENPDGPAIGNIEVPPWCDADRPVNGRVSVTDATGVLEVACLYSWPDGTQGRAACVQADAGLPVYQFTVPAPASEKGGALRLHVVAKGNPAWPITSRSREESVPVACVRRLHLPGTETGGDEQVPVGVEIQQGTGSCEVAVHWLTKLLHDKAGGLPEGVLANTLVIDGPAGREAAQPFRVHVKYSEQTASDLLPGSIAVYRLEGAEWQRVSSAAVDPARREISFDGPGTGGTFAFGGVKRLAWRRGFNGALLTSPAAARIDQSGTLAVILTTGPADGVVYAMDGRGGILWSYDAGDAQPFAAVADLDQDGLDEIAVGGPCLVLLNADGRVRWKAAMDKALAPAIGDLNGDGVPEVVAASLDGSAACFSATGQELWRVSMNTVKQTIPALGHLTSSDKRQAIIATQEGVAALSETGVLLWNASLESVPMFAPALADLNGDGLDEVVVFSRTDTQGYLTALDSQGRRLWRADISRESDWSPVVAPMDGPGTVRIFAQMQNPKQIGLFDEKGGLVRTIDTTGRMLQSPVPLDLDGDAKLDFLVDSDLSYRLWALANDGHPLWSYTPHSFTLPGAKIKLGGSLLVADVDGDSKLEVLGGDDETWLNAVRTEVACERFAVVSGQYHGDGAHTGSYGP